MPTNQTNEQFLKPQALQQERKNRLSTAIDMAWLAAGSVRSKQKEARSKKRARYAKAREKFRPCMRSWRMKPAWLCIIGNVAARSTKYDMPLRYVHPSNHEVCEKCGAKAKDAPHSPAGYAQAFYSILYDLDMDIEYPSDKRE